MTNSFLRYAIVSSARSKREVEAYLPDNYEVIWQFTDRLQYFVIAGRDRYGWSLDGYVIPRLASGLIFAEEVGLDHPIFKEIPVLRAST